MPIESEVKREMIELLLSSSQFDFQRVQDVIECAEKLAGFILEKSQTQELADA